MHKHKIMNTKRTPFTQVTYKILNRKKGIVIMLIFFNYLSLFSYHVLRSLVLKLTYALCSDIYKKHKNCPTTLNLGKVFRNVMLRLRFIFHFETSLRFLKFVAFFVLNVGLSQEKS